MEEQSSKVIERDRTLSRATIDEDYIATLATKTWRESSVQRNAFLERKLAYEESWRNLTETNQNSLWENSSNYHVPITLIYGKAIHARLWQLFSQPSGFFDVRARQEMFKDREATIKQFMNWMIERRANSNTGIRAEIDQFLWDVVFDGSGYLVCYWKREDHTYEEVVKKLTPKTQTTFDTNSLTGVVETTTVEETEVNEERTETIETPQLKRISYEDIILPIGASDPQTAPHVLRKLYMEDDDLKVKASQGVFFPEIVESVLTHTRDIFRQAEVAGDVKQHRNFFDGYTTSAYDSYKHIILEYYGPAYVESEVSEKSFDGDITKKKREIVAWIHVPTNKVLGWTYLSRISPAGIRPIFKADFMTFPDRSEGVGLGEVMYDLSRNIDAIYNLRVDNGTLASIPMFAYRASSSFKPQVMRVKPGTGIPVDDINDLKMFNFPFLTGFGYQEEAQLTQYAERLLSVSDINLGIAPQKVGALRNATGSNLLASQGGIQLEIHFDRIARCISRALQFMFRLSRERMDASLYYRVTGERGEPVFGEVNREDLKGEFDFDIAVDILGQSDLEKQQLSVLRMQTLTNPLYVQTGIVSPANLYEMAKDFLKAHKAGRIDNFVTKPQGYQGPQLSAAERIARIVVGMYMDPPIWTTVSVSGDLKADMAAYESFKQSPEYGLLTQPTQVAALLKLMAETQRMLQAQMSGAPPNVSGMQIPRDGFQGMNQSVAPGGQPGGGIGGGGEALQSQQPGIPNGPVV